MLHSIPRNYIPHTKDIYRYDASFCVFFLEFLLATFALLHFSFTIFHALTDLLGSTTHFCPNTWIFSPNFFSCSAVITKIAEVRNLDSTSPKPEDQYL